MTAIVLEPCADAMRHGEKIATADHLSLVRMGWRARTGSLEAGKWTDMIAVDKNPRDDVRVLQNVKFVIKAGVVYPGEGIARR